jgi:multidrug resistance protein, MATE family
VNAVFKIQSTVLELKKSLRLSLPLIGSQLIYASSGIITTMMIAHLGHKELAANVLVWGIYIALISISFGTLSAVSVLASHSYGINDKKAISLIVNQGIILAFIFAIPMMLIIWFASKILYLTNQDPAVIQLAVPYFHSLIWCMLPLNLLMVMEQFLIGIAVTRLVLFLSFLRVPIEILFFYVLFFGKYGAPKLGLVGIGYGMTLSIVLSLFIIFCYLVFAKKLHQYRLFSNFCRFSGKYLFELIRVGWPLGTMYCIEMALFAAVALMIGQFGKDILAAHQIAYQCLVFTLAVVFGISQGTTVRIGHIMGDNNKDMVKLSLYVNFGIGFCFMLLATIIYIYFPNSIINLGIDTKSLQNNLIVKYIRWFLLLAGIVQLSECFRLISTGALRALKDTRTTMYINLIIFGLALSIAYLLAFVFKFGAIGVWLGLIIALFVGAFILCLRFECLVKHTDFGKLITK